jgi:hypothetical protein
MLERPQLHTLRDCHLVYSLEFQISVDTVEQIKLVFYDKGIFCMRKTVRE